jgi:hypothetical protein
MPKGGKYKHGAMKYPKYQWWLLCREGVNSFDELSDQINWLDTPAVLNLGFVGQHILDNYRERKYAGVKGTILLKNGKSISVQGDIAEVIKKYDDEVEGHGGSDKVVVYSSGRYRLRYIMREEGFGFIRDIE